MKLRIGLGLILAATVLAAQEPDNTKRNQQDRKAGAVTAEQQKETPEDRALTQKIRKAVLDTEGMSVYAKNIKIITRDGKVTLKGPVHTMEEKKKIEDIAKSAAGNANVTSEIEVKGASK